MAKTVIFTYGRFNPPTKGHAKLVNRIKTIASQTGADHVIVASHTQDNKKNPLTCSSKLKHLRTMFPKTKFKGSNKSNPTFIHQLALLDSKYDNVVFVAGSDRVESYTSILHKYNGKEFTFDNVGVVSAGMRCPDAEGTKGISATKMREYAVSNNYTKFKKCLPDNYSNTKKLFNEVRKCLS